MRIGETAENFWLRDFSVKFCVRGRERVASLIAVGGVGEGRGSVLL